MTGSQSVTRPDRLMQIEHLRDAGGAKAPRCLRIPGEKTSRMLKCDVGEPILGY